MAVVAGATRGAGRGIAVALGEAGATVICTGRAAAPARCTPTTTGPKTIEETAALVTECGGVGLAVAVDHLDPAQVSDLAYRNRAATATSTCWSTTSGVPRCSRVARPIGTPRSGSTTSPRACASCGSPSKTHLVTSHHLLDVDGSRPDIWRYIAEVLEPGLQGDPGLYR